MNSSLKRIFISLTTSYWLSFLFLSIGLFLFASALTVFLIVPAIDESLDTSHSKDLEIEAQLEAELFTRYIATQRTILQDLASYPKLVNATMLSSADHFQLIDFLDNNSISGEKAQLVLQNIAGTILFQADHSFLASYGKDEAWVNAILNGDIPYHLQLLGQQQEKFIFKLTVPVSYGGSIEGVLSAEIAASLKEVFVSRLINESAGFKLVQGDITIKSDTSSIQFPRKTSILLPSDIVMSYISDESLIRAQAEALHQKVYLVLLGFTFFISWLILFLIHRKQIVEKLVGERTAELKMLNDMVANANDTFLITEANELDADADGPKIIYINEAFTQTTGYSAEEIIGKTPRILQGEETCREELDKLRNALEKGEAYQGDLLNYTKDNEKYWVDLSITPLRDEAGNITRFGAIGRDMTALKEAERERLELQQAMQLAVEGVSKIDPQGRYTYLNEAYAGTVGYTPEELVGKTWDITVVKDELDKMNSVYQEMLDEGHVVAETIGQHKDGSIVHKQVTMISDYDKQGEFIGHFCFMQNITERKEAETKIRELSNMLQLVLDNVPAAVFWKSNSGNYLGCNKTFAMNAGFDSPEELIDKNDYDMPWAEQADGYRSDDQEVMKLAKPKLGIEEGQTTAEGKDIWLRTDKVPLIKETGEVFGILGTFIDITERKEAERERERLIEKLSESNEELERFAYVASHDLKAPLRAIDNLSKWIEEDIAETMSDETEENMDLMRQRVRRMENLLDDLLEYSRIQRKIDDADTDLVEVNLIVEDIITLTALPDDFEIKLSPALEAIYLPRMPLQQVLFNLINNAIKHHDKKEGLINISVKDVGDKYEFSVSDDGPGIAEEYQQKVFEMFQTLRPRDEVEGSGMGLALVQKIIKALGCNITLQSQLGEGAAFSFTWPKKIKTEKETA